MQSDNNLAGTNEVAVARTRMHDKNGGYCANVSMQRSTEMTPRDVSRAAIQCVWEWCDILDPEVVSSSYGGLEHLPTIPLVKSPSMPHQRFGSSQLFSGSTASRMLRKKWCC